MATRGEDITKLLNDLVEPIRKINILLQQERVSHSLVIGDIASLHAKKYKAFEELNAVQAEIAKLKVEAKSITEAAKEQADRIVKAANEKRVTALAEAAAAEKRLKNVDLAMHDKLMQAVK